MKQVIALAKTAIPLAVLILSVIILYLVVVRPLSDASPHIPPPPYIPDGDTSDGISADVAPLELSVSECRNEVIRSVGEWGYAGFVETLKEKDTFLIRRYLQGGINVNSQDVCVFIMNSYDPYIDSLLKKHNKIKFDGLPYGASCHFHDFIQYVNRHPNVYPLLRQYFKGDQIINLLEDKIQTEEGDIRTCNNKIRQMDNFGECKYSFEEDLDTVQFYTLVRRFFQMANQNYHNANPGLGSAKLDVLDSLKKRLPLHADEDSAKVLMEIVNVYCPESYYKMRTDKTKLEDLKKFRSILTSN
jgi:hypothetical protein